jgi:hypothetical protein
MLGRFWDWDIFQISKVVAEEKALEIRLGLFKRRKFKGKYLL